MGPDGSFNRDLKGKKLDSEMKKVKNFDQMFVFLHLTFLYGIDGKNCCRIPYKLVKINNKRL